jgi:probable dihydroxyacetone kinase regulator
MNTKRKLADALREEMKTTSIPRIRISDLTQRAHINRQTFYYHYHDIYDLLEDMYAHMLEEAVRPDTSSDHWTGSVYDILTCLMENRDFVEKCYHEVDHERYESIYRKEVGKLIDTSLDHIAGSRLSHDDRMLIRDFYTFAVTSIIVKWIGSGMKQSPDALCQKIRIMVNDGYTIAASSFAVQ